MPEKDREKRYAKRDINEQTRYLKAIYEMMEIEFSKDDGDLLVFDDDGLTEESEALLRRWRKLRRTREAFEHRLRQQYERYPLGTIFREARLNAFEKFAVSTTAALAMFDMGRFRGFDVRTLAIFYDYSDIKRIDAEMYFDGECRLEKLGLVMVEPESSEPQVFRRELRIDPNAYSAILGRARFEERDENGCDPRGRSESTLQRLREKIRSMGDLMDPSVSLKNVVLTPANREQLEMALAQAKDGDRIFNEWGLGSQVNKGKGVTLLFAGPPGTGKTMAAEAFAAELGTKMLLVRGADLISPYHGQDELNSAKVFRQAEEHGAVMVFDEADSFFYARHDVRHSVDVGSNRTVNVFLGELERHELPVILTTNRADALDPGLERRLSTKIVFEPPSGAERLKIWKLHLPKKMPLDKDVDVGLLAARFELTGGQIKNAVVAAARTAIYRASRNGGDPRVTMPDLEQGCEKELEGSQVFGTVEREVGFRIR